jgi:hypothetical protein
MTFANQYREFVSPLLVKAFANVNGRKPLRLANILVFTDKSLKSDHLPVCKILYKRRQYTAQLAGVLTV